tara:strand:- start:94767 stop:96506 length:1740 start_codon:yes stop_codon:yes gene_type:complete
MKENQKSGGNTNISTFIPCVTWAKNYRNADLSSDIFSGIITALLFIPQAMAYAMLAGLPVQVGLYASLLPPAIYAIFGTSKALSVGPVSIAAIMVASAISAPHIQSLGTPIESAIILAIEGGAILLIMALLRMGSLVNFISHPVLSGFTSAAAVLIIISQLPNLLGITSPLNCNFNIDCYINYADEINQSTSIIGLFCLALLIFMGAPLIKLLKKINVNDRLVSAISKASPLIVIIIATIIVSSLSLSTTSNIAIVGDIPLGLPALNLSFLMFSSTLWQELLPSAFFISLIAYIESVAIAKVVANITRDKINPNQELIALGLANFGSALSGGMPVAGGFSRTMVNFSAGARTQLATLFTVVVLCISILFFSNLFSEIPKSALASIILVAIFPLIKLKDLISIWKIDISDGISLLLTFIGVLLFGIEQGIALGVIVTIINYLRRASRPHIAIVGRIKNTEQYRNIARHEVETWDEIVIIRIDENITFSNHVYISDFIEKKVIQMMPKHLVLLFSSVSHIDVSAVHLLENLISTLKSKGVILSLAEVKGPVMDTLNKTQLVEELHPGKIYFNISDAIADLT